MIGTAEDFVAYIAKSKPYLVEVEKQVQDINYGEIDIRLTVRAGVVEKIVFILSKTWLKKDNV